MGRLLDIREPAATPAAAPVTPASIAGPARRWRRWRAVVAVAFVMVFLAAVAAVRWTTVADDRLRAELEAWLSDRLASDVRVEQMEVTLLPQVRIHARGVTLRIRNRPDLPPFVTIGSWSGTARLGRLGIRHFDEVRLSSVEIVVPPRRLADIRPVAPASEGARRQRRPPQMRIDRLVADHVVLRVMSRDAAREPHVWDIRDLHLDPFSFDLASPFAASVDTPLPSARAAVTGTAGPWPRGDFDQLPLAGEYVLHGQLEDVPGLRGALAVRGRALGTLDRLATVGTASSPAAGFVSEAGGTLPLDVAFEALFDATNSDVHLTRLDARAGGALVSASGHVVREKGAQTRRIALRVTSPPTSSAADVLRLLVDGDRPPVQGALAVDAALELAAGDDDVLERLHVSGSFDLREARFINARVQGVLEEMSMRGRGWPEPPVAAVRARLRGQLDLSGSRLTLARVALAVPGAEVSGAGHYSLAAETIDFHGVTRLDAPLSQTQRGMRRWLLKPFNRLLAGDGAGTRVVLDVRGTRAAPVVDVDVTASLRGRR